MIDDLRIIEAAQQAERIKLALPKIGVSTDAIFTALVLGKRKPGRPGIQIPPLVPQAAPPWFDEALVSLKGRSLTIAQFLMYTNRAGAGKSERNAVGRWLRASGRMPRKRGGDQRFDI